MRNTAISALLGIIVGAALYGAIAFLSRKNIDTATAQQSKKQMVMMLNKFGQEEPSTCPENLQLFTFACGFGCRSLDEQCAVSTYIDQ